MGKFYQGHWGVMIAGGALALASLGGEAVTLLPRFPKGVTVAAALVIAALFVANGERASAYWTVNRAAVGWISGSISRAEFTSNFDEPFGGGVVEHNEFVGNWLREHTTETEFVAVRGFQPQIYAIARRRYPGRLFWTVFAAGPAGAVHGQEWFADDYERLWRNPPRYVVTLSFVDDGSDGRRWWIARGYAERLQVGEFIILERTPAAAAEPSRSE